MVEFEVVEFEFEFEIKLNNFKIRFCLDFNVWIQHQDEIEVENSFVEGEIYSGLLIITGYEKVKDLQYALTKFEDCYNLEQQSPEIEKSI